MTSEHTPGPWQCAHYECPDVWAIYRKSEGIRIALVYSKADAELIASAPDTAAERDRLRAALGGAIPFLPDAHTQHKPVAEWHQEYAAEIQVSAEATGRTDCLSIFPKSPITAERDSLKAINAELLAALKPIVDFCDDPDGSEKPITLALGLAELLPAARAAINKAKSSS